MDLCLSKLLKIKIMKIVIFDHNRIKLDINNRRKLGGITNMWKLNNTPLNTQWVKVENKGY